MKKFIFISALFLIIPAYAACPVNTDGKVCSISNNTSSLYSLQGSGINIPNQSNSGTEIQKTQIKMPERSASFGELNNPKDLQMQGSLSCQFGNCTQDSDSTFLPNQ